MGRAIPMKFGGLSNPGDDLGARPYEAVTWPEAEPIPKEGVPGGLTGPNGDYPKNVDDYVPVEPDDPDEPDDLFSVQSTPLSGEVGDDAPAPWDKMTTHAALDTFVEDGTNGFTRPSDWGAKTIAQKKEWLNENG